MNVEKTEPSDCCPECGAPVRGGRAACQRLFDEVLAREFGDYRYAREHRLMVDAYSLQHPDDYMRSGKSYAAHLTGAYIAMEHDSVAEANRAVQRWLDGAKALPRPDQPGPRQRGTLTILHVHASTDPDDHVRHVREWAESAWVAWRHYRSIAKDWMDAALRSHAAV